MAASAAYFKKKRKTLGLCCEYYPDGSSFVGGLRDFFWGG